MIEVFTCRAAPDDDTVIDRLLGRLDDQERARAGRFVFARDRRVFVVAHALLRFVLDLRAGPWRWRIVPNAHGKPRLEPADGAPRFSLTHTDGLAAVAIADGHDVGVDAEAAARDPDEAALAALALAPAEIADLDGVEDRRQRLLRLWVAKEALAKAVGLGLSLPLQQLVLRGDPLRIAALPPMCGSANGWSLYTARHGAHWLGLAAPIRGMRFAVREIRPVDILAAPMRGERWD